MNSKNLRKKHEAALAAALSALWEQAHGIPAGRVRVLVGPDSVAAWIEDVLNPAERLATQHVEGQALVQRYVERLLAAIQLDLQAQVEAITGRRTVSSSVRADVETGHVLGFFILGERQRQPPTPGSKSPPEETRQV